MDVAFDVSSARKKLQEICEEAVNGISLSMITQTPRWTDGVKVARVEYPTTWRLLQGDGNNQEELVFTVRGVITAKDLPPILERPRLSAQRFKYLRQGITISGLGIVKFDQVITAASEIFGIFDRSFAEGQLESWSPSGSTGPDDCASLDASNRYMTPRKDVPDAEHIPFTISVDPKRLLEDMAIGSDHVHMEENEVLYFASQVNDAGMRSFVEAQPQVFRIGDIVELQVSFVAVPLKGERFKMVTVMRSIALLDGSFGKSMLKNKAVKTLQSAPKMLLSVKRRVGYGSTEVETSAEIEKRSRMDVDESAKGLVSGFSTKL